MRVWRRAPYPAHIDLRFGNAAREFLDFLTGVRSGNLARERRNFFRKRRVGKNGNGKPVAEPFLAERAPTLSPSRTGA